jgi:hypothetical protein
MPAENDPIPARRAKPLLRRTQLLPGESLPSLLERLTQLNYYPHSRVLSWVCHERLDSPANPDSLSRPKWVQTFLKLAELSQVSVEKLYEASDHRFIPVLTPPGQMPWMGAASRPMVTPILAHSHLRPTTAAQFCPLCLKSSSSHRLSWVPAAAAICLEHSCLLVQNCPGCKKRVSVSEIVRQSCRTCLADLRMAKALSVAGDTLGILSQQAIQHWLSVAPAPRLPDNCYLPDPSPAKLYHFLEDLCRRLLACRADWPALPPPLEGLADRIPVPANHQQRLAPAQVYHLHHLAFASLLDWPQGLFRFLDALRNCNPLAQTQRLKAIRRDWFQEAEPASPFVFAQQAFLDYLLARRIPIPLTMVKQFKAVSWFVERTGLWTEEHTAQVLELSVEDLRRFFPNGPLINCRWPQSRPSAPFFEHDKVLAVQSKWRSGWSISEASSWLGISKLDVVRLAKRNILALLDGAEKNDPALWVFSRKTVEDFFEKVTNRLELFSGDAYHLCRLWELDHYLLSVGIDCALLLQQVADGLLPAYKREPEIRSLENIYFLDEEVDALPDRLYARQGLVAERVFAREKDISPRLIWKWVQDGLIKPKLNFRYVQYFERSALEQLAASLGFFET